MSPSLPQPDTEHRRQTLAQPHELTAHALTATEIFDQMDTGMAGLTEEEARRRLESVGPNRLPEEKKAGILQRFFKHFHDLLIYILLGAALITAVLGHWVDTSVILAVVLLNALIGFIQEGKAEQALAGIRRMLSSQARVKRDGQWEQLDAETLVPGDLVRLRSGDRVPADLRLLEVNQLRLEESALTGESLPTEKQVEPVAKLTVVGDRTNMAFAGSIVTAGRGVGVVTASGVETELGRITTLIAQVEALTTPLTRQMAAFSRTLSCVILAMAALLFLLGWLLHDYSVSELFFAAIGFAVAAIPEGLPAILTITLAIGVQSMARQNAITRHLTAVETLGSVTVICSDKTGTLTRNEMTVKEVLTQNGSYTVQGIGYAPAGHVSREGDEVHLSDQAELLALIEVMAICNDSSIALKDGQWTVIGEPTEGALITLARKAGFVEEGYERIAAIPFESEAKFMATLHQLPSGERRILIKGAPDRLLAKCDKQHDTTGAAVPLERGDWHDRIQTLAEQGLRVLAAAVREVPQTHETLELSDLEQDLIFLGLVGIIDPPRPEAIEAIRLCHEAGIRVKMITGDHVVTACSIGRKMGISSGQEAITGGELEQATDEELRRIVQSHDIFARTSPEHKLRIVQALQANGEVVAMTGDGVNDAPALKRADVGVAMGIKGTEATKQAADIVLADDNFATIERAVEQGRTIYDNLRKAILFILPTNGGEALVILNAVVFGLVLPVTPVQILWVNMVTAVTLALALAFEPSEPGIMQRPPRDTRARILDQYFLGRIGYVSLLIALATSLVFVVEIRLGEPIAIARTVTVNTLVGAQVFYLLNSRFISQASWLPSHLFTNPVIWYAIGVLALLQLTFVYAPFMHVAFDSAPLELRHWLIPLGVGLGVFLLVEAEKTITRRWGG